MTGASLDGVGEVVMRVCEVGVKQIASCKWWYWAYLDKESILLFFYGLFVVSSGQILASLYSAEFSAARLD